MTVSPPGWIACTPHYALQCPCGHARSYHQTFGVEGACTYGRCACPQYRGWRPEAI